MGLNKPSGNMYPWAWTWNPLGGECKHQCGYCYVSNRIAPRLAWHGKYHGEARLIDSEFHSLNKPDDGKVIFVESCGDLFGWWIPDDLIFRVLNHCRKHPANTYLFQTKNPKRYSDILGKIETRKSDRVFPPKTILGSTIETNRSTTHISKAPDTWNRLLAITGLRVDNTMPRFDWMISIEPILRFDLPVLAYWIYDIKPKFVSIGADSGDNKLVEPLASDVKLLIKVLATFTEVRVKKNLLERFGEDVIG